MYAYFSYGIVGEIASLIHVVDVCVLHFLRYASSACSIEHLHLVLIRSLEILIPSRYLLFPCNRTDISGSPNPNKLAELVWLKLSLFNN